jgi:hypothetical protein
VLLQQRLSAVLLATTLVYALGLSKATAGLVAHWTFDDSGDRTADSSGNGNDLTNVGTVTYIGGGVVGDAMSVSGAESPPSGKAFHGFGPSLTTDELTISMWADLGPGSAERFRDYFEFGASAGEGYVLENTGGNDPDGYNILPIAGAGGLTTTPTPDLLGGGFHHLVMTMSASNNTARLYIDGGLNDSATWSATANVNFMTIGGRFNTGIRNIDADFDDVQIYDFALAPGQVAFLFNNPGLTIVPEPSTFGLAALGLLSLGFVGWRRHRRA